VTTAVDARETRDRILDATIRLLRRQGYTATGIKQIVLEGDAPLGSVYHYFPGGKEQIGAEALARSGEKIRRTIERAGDVSDLPAAINAYFTVNAERLLDSNYERGCPIATVALETASDNERIRKVCEDVFHQWQVTLTKVFVDAGIKIGRASCRERV
jgi:TetR/AcrR family transcriptional regulator, lmrAB and yxaGH operons repressor